MLFMAPKCTTETRRTQSRRAAFHNRRTAAMAEAGMETCPTSYQICNLKSEISNLQSLPQAQDAGGVLAQDLGLGALLKGQLPNEGHVTGDEGHARPVGAEDDLVGQAFQLREVV